MSETISSIKKIQVVGSGDKTVITYKVIKKVGDYNVESERVEKSPRIITPEMRVILNKLRVHMLRMYGVWAASLDKYYDFTEGKLDEKAMKALSPEQSKGISEKLEHSHVSSVLMMPGCVAIEGRVARLNGPGDYSDNHVALNTGLILEDDGYDMFAEVEALANELAKEAKGYIRGEKFASNSTIAYNALMKEEKDENEVKARLEAMSEDEQKEFVNKYLEDNDMIVVGLDDVLDPDNVIQDAAEEEAKEEIESSPEEEAAEKPPKKKPAAKKAPAKKAEEKEEVKVPAASSEEDDF